MKSCAGANGQVLATEPAAAFFLYPLPLATRGKSTIRRQAIKSEEEGIQKEENGKDYESERENRRRKKAKERKEKGKGW
jgi:hypothetical protein